MTGDRGKLFHVELALKVDLHHCSRHNFNDYQPLLNSLNGKRLGGEPGNEADYFYKCYVCIGGKEDPVRLVFTSPAGPSICATVIDMGDRFRMIVNDVDVIEPEQPLPKLPVARTLWYPEPSLEVAAAAWIYAGGAHHTSFSQAITMEHLEDFAEIAGIELVRIDAGTKLHEFRKELFWSDAAYRLR
jgi:L-arabinose isomerase